MCDNGRITIERAENGFVITCRHQSKHGNNSVLNGPCVSMPVDEEVYVASDVIELMSIVKREAEMLEGGEDESHDDKKSGVIKMEM